MRGITRAIVAVMLVVGAVPAVGAAQAIDHTEADASLAGPSSVPTAASAVHADGDGDGGDDGNDADDADGRNEDANNTTGAGDADGASAAGTGDDGAADVPDRSSRRQNYSTWDDLTMERGYVASPGDGDGDDTPEALPWWLEVVQAIIFLERAQCLEQLPGADPGEPELIDCEDPELLVANDTDGDRPVAVAVRDYKDDDSDGDGIDDADEQAQAANDDRSTWRVVRIDSGQAACLEGDHTRSSCDADGAGDDVPEMAGNGTATESVTIAFDRMIRTQATDHNDYDPNSPPVAVEWAVDGTSGSAAGTLLWGEREGDVQRIVIEYDSGETTTVAATKKVDKSSSMRNEGRADGNSFAVGVAADAPRDLPCWLLPTGPTVPTEPCPPIGTTDAAESNGDAGAVSPSDSDDVAGAVSPSDSDDVAGAATPSDYPMQVILEKIKYLDKASPKLYQR